MKFLKEDGTIEEGFKLSDTDVDRMDRLEAILHAAMCNGSYHASYERGVRRCRKIAARIITSGVPVEDALEQEFLPAPEPLITVEDAVGPDPEQDHPSPFPTGVEA
jgi:hypothetical protein